jgi:hypothetical protein
MTRPKYKELFLDIGLRTERIRLRDETYELELESRLTRLTGSEVRENGSETESPRELSEWKD